ncbi:hypothetical protein ACWDZ4_20675 [Streptomyces sp. NPDC003016]
MAPSITSVANTRFATMSEAEIRAAERVLKAGTWAITAGALLFSVLTVTPLVTSVTPPGWEWTAPILPLVVDAAVVIVVQLDSVISRLGGKGGPWPAILRWMTGVMTLALNVGNSALHQDWVGVAVHSVAPLLLIVTAEAGLAYRRAINNALARIAREQAAAVERDRAEQEAREQRRREQRAQEKAEQEKAEREAREHALRQEQERAEREEARLREEREHALALERERTEREAAERRDEAEREERERQRQERQEQAAREHALRVERERAEWEAAERREQAEREERERKEKAVQEERERREKATRMAQVAGVPAPKAPAKQPVKAGPPAQFAIQKQTSVVIVEEFAGMTKDEAEAALFRLYKQARDENTYPNLDDNPLFRPGAPFCGSMLGKRLGRSGAAGRTNVKPKFERWYHDSLKQETEKSEDVRELVSVG